jgi:2-C-methyl-D-erythritol 2,4-cyclodiphosphate synthase
MRETLAELMEISADRVSVKATTTEKLGFVGREEGIAVYATALIWGLGIEYLSSGY